MVNLMVQATLVIRFWLLLDISHLVSGVTRPPLWAASLSLLNILDRSFRVLKRAESTLMSGSWH